MQGERLYNLDIIRFVAALAVVAFHYLFRGYAEGGYSPLAFPEAAPFAMYGHLGVSCFFMISGFVIAYSAEGRDVVAFASARISRLYPAFIVCMTITAVTGFLLAAPGNPLRPAVAQYLANLTMIAPVLGQGFMDGAYWSIFVEIIFYGWVALFIALGLFEKRMPEIVIGWLCIAFVNEAYLGIGALKHLFLTAYAGHFAAGIMLYRLMKSGWRMTLPDGLILAAAAMLIALGEINAIAYMRETYKVEVGIGTSLAVLAFSALMVMLAIRVKRPLLPANVCLALGGISYPLYLLHQHIGYLVFQTAGGVVNRWLLVAVTTLVLIALAWAIWRFVERPASAPLRRGLRDLGGWALVHMGETIRKYRPARS